MLDPIVLEVLGSCHEIVDSNEYVENVTLYTTIFLNGLRLPFCCPIWDVLDYLALAPLQLYPNTWRILLSCCVVWCLVLGADSEDYPNLISRKFFCTHRVRCQDDICVVSIPRLTIG